MRLPEWLTRYEKREHDLLILSGAQLVCILIVCVLSALLGEPLPLKALAGAGLAGVVGIYAYLLAESVDSGPLKSRTSVVAVRAGAGT